jgi:S-(hydroxymethyl)glutathione dehydrogenase/alcohol dehydrogenase
LSVEEVDLDPPGPGEVLVEVKAAGVCHSDLHPARDDWPMRTPLVLGHEGAGIVHEIGAGVTRVKPGDRVVLCWAPACGACPYCVEGRAILCDRLDRTNYRNRLPSGASRLHANNQDLNPFLGTACFADFAVVAEEGVVRMAPENDDVPFAALATLGCAVVTGVGAVLTAARVPAGSTVAVVGAGGVGLNVIQGCVIAGAERIIAIDRRAAPLELARQFGATDLLESPANTGDAVRDLTAASAHGRAGARSGTGPGADFVFDTVGTPHTLTDSFNATRKGGTVVLTGLSRIDTVGGVPTFPLVMQEKRLIGSAYGSGCPTEDIVRLVELNRQGRLKLEELVSRTYPLAKVNDALAALADGMGARGIILR